MAWYHVGACSCPVGCCDCGVTEIPVYVYYNPETDEIYESRCAPGRGWGPYTECEPSEFARGPLHVKLDHWMEARK